ncbi:simple sugar transport system ATP-binding protein [Kribbella orskensis]|uniref:Simple sugar transport system ATP-binding protein n=1 Tax=Kribbella orskensis TaxID=2512216 RepID=A0ABY2BVY5_9ACTN|nr:MULTISPECIES: ABC transporter ATP-binding protein [Kribbella]TCN44058.1 simple sugar transport system ATP-binding protein [Kribbella sp. VKM Ac-2500]TCO32164.1 simple sugar transport system ATP-binding protein [Kribbella orskensis]
MHLELSGLTKSFGSLVANDHIDLVIEPGQIHCLLGENGAGKSTLMNMLYGLLQPDSGEIVIDGAKVRISSPSDAIAQGIGMVHQHFMLVPVFTVAENIMLGREYTRAVGVLDRKKADALVTELSERYGFQVDPEALVEDIPVGVQQRVEIIKALANDARVLILDEPTAVLTPAEIDELIAVMRQLKENGTSIVFITHKLKEVKAIADTITVIRRGKVVGSAEPSATEEELAELMVGRAVDLVVDKDPATPGDTVLRVEGLTVIDERGFTAVDGVDLEVRAGEILAVAGVQGNGQTELAEALLGLTPIAAGRISLDGNDLTGRTTRDRLDAGIGYVPEDRAHDGFVGSFTVAENLVLDMVRRAPFGKGLSLRTDEIEKNAQERVEEFDIRTQSTDLAVSSLSGGNQQKVVLARELSRPLKLLVASQPTRGVDVGSIEFLHTRMVKERDNGTAVLIVSTELDEIAALADRVAVMYRGKVVGVVPADTPRDELGLMMAGASKSEAEVVATENPTTLGTI